MLVNTNTPYQTIDEFFDAFSLSHASALLGNLIKTAASYKTWKGACPANAIYFTDRLYLLAEAAFTIQQQYDYREEVVLDKENTGDIWMLDRYDIYCGWHRHSTPWHFFPRHLSQKEFIDPYRALKKFTGKYPLSEWKEILKELCFYSLSPHCLDGFDDGVSIIVLSQLLHKLIEATHLIEVRFQPGPPKKRRQWKDREAIERPAGKTTNEQSERTPSEQPITTNQ
jgi:hypothetical protein